MAGKERGPGAAGGEVQDAVRGLPDRATITLAEAVSWAAWGQPIACDVFRDARHRVAAARAVLRQAAGVPRYDAAGTSEALHRAWHRLCDLVAAGEIRMRGKGHSDRAGFQPIPREWFWPDPQPPEAILHDDGLVRVDLEPLSRLLDRTEDSPCEWFAVRLERADLARHAMALRAGPTVPGEADRWALDWMIQQARQTRMRTGRVPDQRTLTSDCIKASTARGVYITTRRAIELHRTSLPPDLRNAARRPSGRR